MKLAIHYIYWQKDLDCRSYIPFVKKAKKLGFDGLELGDRLILNMSENEVDDLAAVSKENDIELSIGLDPDTDMALTSDDEQIQQHGIDFYKNVFPRIQKLGITVMAGNMLNAVPRLPISHYRKLEWQRGIASIREIGQIAQNYGIKVNIEVCNRFESHILNTARQGINFVQEVGLPNVLLTLDTFHMNIEEDSFSNAIHTAGKYLGHFHFGENHRHLPGTGHLPWCEIRDALLQIGYNGILTMEPLVSSNCKLGDYAHIWRDMTNGANEEQMDLYAAKAAAYIRYLFQINNDTEYRNINNFDISSVEE
jgi:D-psicose/D-tagatose/L-ribulose 3-epimerase